MKIVYTAINERRVTSKALSLNNIVSYLPTRVTSSHSTRAIYERQSQLSRVTVVKSRPVMTGKDAPNLKNTRSKKRACSIWRLVFLKMESWIVSPSGVSASKMAALIERRSVPFAGKGTQ